MKLRLTILILVAAIVALLVIALFVVPRLAIYLSEGAADPDIIVFYALLVELVLLLLAAICGFVAILAWYFQQNQKKQFQELMLLSNTPLAKADS